MQLIKYTGNCNIIILWNRGTFNKCQTCRGELARFDNLHYLSITSINPHKQGSDRVQHITLPTLMSKERSQLFLHRHFRVTACQGVSPSLGTLRGLLLTRYCAMRRWRESWTEWLMGGKVGEQQARTARRVNGVFEGAGTSDEVDGRGGTTA